jgi:hypothetical protein
MQSNDPVSCVEALTLIDVFANPSNVVFISIEKLVFYFVHWHYIIISIGVKNYIEVSFCMVNPPQFISFQIEIFLNQNITIVVIPVVSLDFICLTRIQILNIIIWKISLTYFEVFQMIICKYLFELFLLFVKFPNICYIFTNRVCSFGILFFLMFRLIFSNMLSFRSPMNSSYVIVFQTVGML